MYITRKAFNSLSMYPSDRTMKTKILQDTFCAIANELGSGDQAWMYLYAKRINEKSGITLGSHVMKRYQLPVNFDNLDNVDEKFDKLESLVCSALRIDPDHEKLIKEQKVPELIKILEKMRDYHELRFRSRVALAISYVKKPNKTFKVNHWIYSNTYALVRIKGLVLEKDKGVAYISYFF